MTNYVQNFFAQIFVIWYGPHTHTHTHTPHTHCIHAKVVFVVYLGFLLTAAKRLVACTSNYRPTIPAVKCIDLHESISANAHLFAKHVVQLVKYSYVPV
jgi:hypothetical protein